MGESGVLQSVEEKNGIGMTEIVATNIISPLGRTTEQNFRAVACGRTALSHYGCRGSFPGPFTAAAFGPESIAELAVEGFTRFESLVISSVEEALSRTDVDTSSDRCLFILSTTKADVEQLGCDPSEDGAYLAPGAAARKIARHLGFVNDPLVVCNACISGVTAQVLAHRLLSAGYYDTAVVCGADCLSDFALAGFSSFKSLSEGECRPFDIERNGLNLGEAAATVVLRRCVDAVQGCLAPEKSWKISSCSLSNDAYHVSAPSPDGDGAFRAINETMTGRDCSALSLLNVHGTATMFNDQMESRAVERAGLSDVPATALKGYFGHTLGASGLLESIISMAAADAGTVPATRGFSQWGVSGRINVSAESRECCTAGVLKISSGFGGCNGAILYSKDGRGCGPAKAGASEAKTLHTVRITPQRVELDGKISETDSACGRVTLDGIYRNHGWDYPRFHKMDSMGKLLFAATELLVSACPFSAEEPGRAVLLFNASTSVLSDRRHIASYSGEAGFFPSPSVFLYTLPNVAVGEIAIRYGIKGETSLMILDGRNDPLMDAVVDATLKLSDAENMITGWLDCPSEDEFIADLKFLSR